ncbi:MAG: hypothetical protein IJA97_01415 [Clostridia bacterium]|nr:hypothetical protein [Clostridia bacterium]
MARVNYPPVITKRISVNSFASGMKGTLKQKQIDLSKGELIHNFDCSSGALTGGFGVSNYNQYILTNISGLEVLGLFPYIAYDHDESGYVERIIIYCSDGGLYYALASGSWYRRIGTVTFSECPCAISYNYLDKDVLLLSTATDGLYMLDGLTITKIDGAPPFNSLCVHKERLFATSSGEGKSLWFSDDFDPTNWSISLDEAGFIEFSDEYGKLLKVVSFLDYVYAFREYGISRVTAYGDQQDFSVDNLYGKYGKIYGGSITDCGNFIVMVTSQGIYTFNGLSAVKILDEYDHLIRGVDNSRAKGAFDGRRLYLMLYAQIDGEVERVVICYDTEKKTAHLARGFRITDLCFFGGSVGQVMCSFNDSFRVGVIDDSGNYLIYYPDRVWRSATCDFGITEREKVLKRVTLYSAEEASLTVENGIKSFTYSLKAGMLNDIKPMLKGERFRFTIKSKSFNPEISSLSVYVDYIKESV